MANQGSDYRPCTFESLCKSRPPPAPYSVKPQRMLAPYGAPGAPGAPGVPGVLGVHTQHGCRVFFLTFSSSLPVAPAITTSRPHSAYYLPSLVLRSQRLDSFFPFFFLFLFLGTGSQGAPSPTTPDELGPQESNEPVQRRPWITRTAKNFAARPALPSPLAGCRPISLVLRILHF